MKIFNTVLVIFLLVGLGLFISYHQTNKDVVINRTYEGRIYLEEQEYEGFKRFLAENPEIEIQKMEVLSSPNALIDMTLSAPPSVEVPYDLEVTTYYKSTTTDLVVVISAIIFIFLLILGVFNGFYHHPKSKNSHV